MTEQPKPPFRHNLRGFLIFVGVLLSVLASAHYYFWLRLVHDSALAHPWDWMGTTALLLAGLSIPTMIYARLQKPELFHRLSPWTFLWMGWSMVLLLSLGAGDLLKAVWGLGHPGAPAVSGNHVQEALAVAVLGLGAWALSQARPRVIRRDITLAKLPASFEGFRLVQISDLHVGGRVDRAYVQDVVDQVNELQPDLIAITGDLLDADLERVREDLQPLKALEARHGVFYVTGNHEYFHGIQAWLEEVPRLGLRLLMNERVRISNGVDSFDLAGVDDFLGRTVPGHGPDFEKALGGRETGVECILLAHQPKAFPAAQEHGVGLLLAGHTHAGQMWPFMHLVKLDQPYVAGHYEKGGTQLYVNQGTGYWGPPMRLGTRSEITLLTLLPAKKAAL